MPRCVAVAYGRFAPAFRRAAERPPPCNEGVIGVSMHQLSLTTVLLLLLCFYGLSFLMTLRIGKKDECADGYMTSNGAIGFGMSAASMTATWVWAASIYAAASSGYKYGLSGAIHYGF